MREHRREFLGWGFALALMFVLGLALAHLLGLGGTS